jgi:ATP-dependent Lon protease
MSLEQRIPRTLPVMFSNNLVIYPFTLLPLIISDEKMKKIIDYALANDKLLAFFFSEGVDAQMNPNLKIMGTAVSIIRMIRNQDGSISLLLQGVTRILLEKVVQTKPFLKVEIEPIGDEDDNSPEIQAKRKIASELIEKIIDESSELSKDVIVGLKNINLNNRFADVVAGNLPFQVTEKQEILETLDLNKRFDLLNKFMTKLIKQLKIENRIRNKIQLDMDEDQRKYFLKEQMDAIKAELGEDNELDMEIIKWKKKIKDKKLPEYVKDVAEEELSRMSLMNTASGEYNLIRNYLQWIIDLPWNKFSKDRLNLKKIEQILNKDHFGLNKAKERIIEFIAVKKLKSKLKGPILCFVGPPGVGKTSLGRSIARAMNRKFIRVSLGGIHDEAEIRGHRRTYIGAMPGKIINEIKRCGTSNPLFMLDEIDKVGKDFRGDPTSALLEVLDPEQNFSFMDNYLDLKYDLSEIFFITTANRLDTIPAPLRDRMEIIEFSGYTEEDKIEITKKYLIKKELENNGLTSKNIRIRQSAIIELIRYYVREAGVRNLQRIVAKIMRKVARKVAEGDTHQFNITNNNLSEYLGHRKYLMELANRKPEVGVVTGMAWTIYGGEILFCEATKMKGNGKLILTGLLGEVMKESARIALSFIKANAQKYKINIDDFDKYDIHIHLPSGSVPKEGPSAGVTLTTALISLLTEKKVRHNISMTGEITLLGKVLPIGGVRDKVLAAKRAGIKKVLLPKENMQDFNDIPEKIRSGIDVAFESHIDEILEEVILEK